MNFAKLVGAFTVEAKKCLFKTRFALALLTFCGSFAQAEEPSPLTAFETYVLQGDLKAAHFYLENKLIKPEAIESSRLFVEAIFESNMAGTNTTAPFSIRQLPSIKLLYNYLGAIHPIDLNGLHRCKFVGTSLNNEYVCNLSSFLYEIQAQPEVFKFFLERGMTLTAFSRDTLPPVVVLASHLGVGYGLNELNWFAKNGAPLGQELYSPTQLKAWGGLISRPYAAKLAADKPESSDYNFVDLLTLSLVNTNYRTKDLNRHRDFLCRYITHVAGQMAPTFDHFSYLLKNVDEFRAENIGQASHPEQWGMVNRAVFPHSCRVLVEAMGRSSAQLDDMITYFSAKPSGLKTAQWLVSLKKNRDEANVKSN